MGDGREGEGEGGRGERGEGGGERGEGRGEVRLTYGTKLLFSKSYVRICTQ